ncbi:MAG: Uncharacterized protein G01um101493_28 [Microgenomates group bacterium Gr01-1014_93]|nr:MAG: Uncharacterized protein G01um101493_28 [Microgenomates group bacterium Gr01-1014_93]
MDILDTILTNTYTIHDLRHRARILKSHLENKLFAQGSNENLPAEDIAWLDSLGDDFLKYFTKENLYSTFKDLQEKVDKITPLIIYLSFEVDIAQIEGISQWIRKNLANKLIFEIKYDPAIIGGAAFTYKGVYRDYSLRSKIQQNSEIILTEFKKYIR